MFTFWLTSALAIFTIGVTLEVDLDIDWDKFRDGWASGSMTCNRCGKVFEGVRFRYCDHDKVEGEWPKCCGEFAKFNKDWKPVSEAQAQDCQGATERIITPASLPPYGYCPHCGKPGIERERRLNGNDKCEGGHVYPSSEARRL